MTVSLAHSATAPMAHRNTRTQQPPPPPEEEPEGSQNDRRPAPGHSHRRQGRSTRHDARHQDIGEEIDITLTDDSGPSQPNSQTAPPLPPQTSNNSRATPTPAASQVGSRSQPTSLDVKHFFRKVNNEPTVCVPCEYVFGFYISLVHFGPTHYIFFQTTTHS
jgi:hypothetical protein